MIVLGAEGDSCDDPPLAHRIVRLERHRRGPCPALQGRAMIKDYIPGQVRVSRSNSERVRSCAMRFSPSSRGLDRSQRLLLPGRQVVRGSLTVRRSYDEITTRRSFRAKSRLGEKKIRPNLHWGGAIVTKSV
jgi:hypothetical protein